MALTIALLCGSPNVPMEQAEQEQQALPTLQEVQEINQYVNGLISYGVGPQVEGRNPCEREILDAGEGHCGMYAYLFVKELSRHGYDEAMAYDISSTYCGTETAQHSVVSVVTQEGNYVFDPTYGIYYQTDINTLIDCGHAEDFAVGETYSESFYLTNRFFSEIEKVSCYEDVRNSYDLNLLKWYNSAVISGIPTVPELSQEIVYDTTVGADSIVLSFDEPVEFYRLEFGFSEQVQVPLELEFEVPDSAGKTHMLDGRLVQDAYRLTFQLEEAYSSSEIHVELQGCEELPQITFLNLYQ